MTANQSTVSVQSASSVSAIQARASSQSAAIALLGAGMSSTSGGESSFAQSLQSESNRQATPAGLFSDDPGVSRTSPPADRTRTDGSRRKNSEERDPAASTSERESTGQAPQARDSEDSGPVDAAASAREIADAPLAATNNAPVTNGLAPAATPQGSEQTQPAADDPARSPSAGANENKPRQPSDPLRLIPHQQQASASESGAESQAAAHQVAGQAPALQSATSDQRSTRAGEKAANGTVRTTQSGSTSANGVLAATPLNNGAPTNGVPAATANGTVQGVGGTQAGTQVGPSANQVVQPRNGAGRLVEQQVTLKLKTTPPTANGTAQLSEAEVSAAERQIGQGLTAAFRTNTPKVTLWMSPETLGKVRIHLTFDQGTISARFEATSDATKDLLAQNMGALRDALQSRGLAAQQIEVVSIPDWTNQNGSQSGSSQNGQGNGQLPSQTPNGGNPSGQGGQPHQGYQDNAKSWTSANGSEPAGQHAASGSDAQISLSINPRLMNLQAHLELDAVA